MNVKKNLKIFFLPSLIEKLLENVIKSCEKRYNKGFLSILWNPIFYFKSSLHLSKKC
jgi:hypothetical protein